MTILLNFTILPLILFYFAIKIGEKENYGKIIQDKNEIYVDEKN